MTITLLTKTQTLHVEIFEQSSTLTAVVTSEQRRCYSNVIVQR